MLSKLFFSIIFTLLILNISIPIKEKEVQKNSLINTFCIASLKSQLNFNDKNKSGEISHFTCDCFSRKFKSGSSIKISREHCRRKAAEKYNLQ